LFDQQHKNAPLSRPLRRRHHLENRCGAARYFARAQAPRSFPAGVIYPTAVQGDDAPGQIVRAIELANARQECDVLIVGRGGGSLEDLWSFNDERVARAIFASPIPSSAPSAMKPTSLSPILSPTCARRRLRRRRNGQPQPAGAAAPAPVRAAASGNGDGLFPRQPPSSLYPAFHRLQQQHPQLRLARQQTALESLRQRMRFALETQIKRADQRQQRAAQRLNQQNPQPRIHRAQSRIQQLEYRLAENIRARLGEQRERFGNAVTHLEAVSPLATLARGYSVTSASDGKVLKQTKQVREGDCSPPV
jgi:exodeoxyribonuclease VII large subunit